MNADFPHYATRVELIKARTFDSLVLVLLIWGPQLVLHALAAPFDSTNLGGLLCTMVILVLFFFAACGLAGWWFGNHAVNNWRSFGYRRYNLWMVYGDTMQPVSVGGQLLMVLLSPVDLAFGLFAVNAKKMFVWTRRITVIYVPPGQPLPTGRLPRDSGPPVDPNWEELGNQ